MRYAIADCRISIDIQKKLENYADKIIKLVPFGHLPMPVASHPDMLLWHCAGRIVTYRDYFEANRNIFAELSDFEIMIDSGNVCAEYPHDIALNCANVGNRIIAHRDYISPVIMRIADEEGMQILHTRQGYAKCSTVLVGDNAVITADRSIEKSALAAHIDVLRVNEGNVALEGYNTGFIGGAGGTTDTEVLFCGNLDLHPDGERIREFCGEHGKQAVSLSSAPLYDYGTVMLIDNP